MVLHFKGLAVQFLHNMGTHAFMKEHSMYAPLLQCILSTFTAVTIDRWSTHSNSNKGQPIETEGTVMVKGMPCILLEAKRFDLISSIGSNWVFSTHDQFQKVQII